MMYLVKPQHYVEGLWRLMLAASSADLFFRIDEMLMQKMPVSACSNEVTFPFGLRKIAAVTFPRLRDR